MVAARCPKVVNKNVEEEDEVLPDPTLKGKVFCVISGVFSIGGIAVLVVGVSQRDIDYRMVRISFISELIGIFFAVCSATIFIKREKRDRKNRLAETTRLNTGSIKLHKTFDGTAPVEGISIIYLNETSFTKDVKRGKENLKVQTRNGDKTVQVCSKTVSARYACSSEDEGTLKDSGVNNDEATAMRHEAMLYNESSARDMEVEVDKIEVKSLERSEMVKRESETERRVSVEVHEVAGSAEVFGDNVKAGSGGAEMTKVVVETKHKSDREDGVTNLGFVDAD